MRAKIFLAAVLALTMAACDDDDGGGGFTPESPFRDLSSPQNVLHNIAACNNERDDTQLLPIVHDDFEFYISGADVGVIPSDIAPQGIMSRGTFLEIAHSMMDEAFVPCVPEPMPDLQIEDMVMTLSLPGDFSSSDVEGAPAGACMAYVNLDLRVDTAGPFIYVVHSRPLLHFAPDFTAGDTDGVTWQLWRVDDGENLNNPAYGHSGSMTKQKSWGAVLSLYYGDCE